MCPPQDPLSLRIPAHSQRVRVASWLTHKMSIPMGQVSNTVYEVLMGMDPIVPIWKDVPASTSKTANP